MALVFSYSRFSSQIQSKGDSTRRQLELSEKWTQARGLTLDTKLRMSDEGISAFKGANKIHGALSEFLAKIRIGLIPAGSYLLVESLDRLSREDVLTALGTFSSIISAGVTIVTLQDGIEYNKESLQNIGNLMYSLIVMSTANQESVKKSIRISAVWNQKKKNAATGKAMSAVCPSWIRLENGKYVVIEKNADVIRKMITMSANGEGLHAILKKMNQDKTACFTQSGTFHKSWLLKVLSSGSPIGHYQPCKHVNGKYVPDGTLIENYYPRIVSDELYYKSLTCLKNRATKRGRVTKKNNNLFQGLVVWADYDMMSEKITETTFRWNEKKPGHEQLILLSKAGQTLQSFKYKPFEEIILMCLSELSVSEILETGESKADKESKAQAIAAKIARINKNIEAFQGQMSEGEVTPVMVKMLATETKNLMALEAQLKDIQNANKITQSTENELKELLKKSKDDKDLRIKISSTIRNMVDKIVVTDCLSDLMSVAIKFRADNEGKHWRFVSIDPKTYKFWFINQPELYKDGGKKLLPQPISNFINVDK